jgi:WD40 repeat protein
MEESMTSVFQELQNEHEALLYQQEAEEDILATVQNYVAKVRQESQQITLPGERDQLRAILRYWSAYVYQHTGEYPETSLLPPITMPQTHDDPFSADPPKPSPTLRYFQWKKLLISLLSLLIVSQMIILPILILESVNTESQAYYRVTATASYMEGQPTKASSLLATAPSMVQTPTPILGVTRLPSETPSLRMTNTPTPNPDGATSTPTATHTTTPKPTIIPNGLSNIRITTDNLDDINDIEQIMFEGRAILDMDISPDGQYLALSGSGGLLELWDISSSLPIAINKQSLPNVGFTQSVSFHPSVQLIATGYNDRLVRIWSIPNLNLVTTLAGHEGFVFTTVFSPDGEWLASGSGDGTVRLWNIQTGVEVGILSVSDKAVYEVAFSPDGTAIAIANLDAGLAIWDTTSLTERCRYADRSILTVAYHPDDEIIIAGSKNGELILLESTNCTVQATFSEYSDFVNSVAFAPDGSWFASGGRDGRLVIGSGDTPFTRFSVPETSIETIAISPDQTIIVTGHNNGGIIFWGIDSSCPEAFTTRLSIGMQAQVVASPNLRVRERPTASASTVYGTSLSRGRTVYILDGPVCDGGMLWWKIETGMITLSNGERHNIVGWVAEESGDQWMLEPSR